MPWQIVSTNFPTDFLVEYDEQEFKNHCPIFRTASSEAPVPFAFSQIVPKSREEHHVLDRMKHFGLGSGFACMIGGARGSQTILIFAGGDVDVDLGSTAHERLSQSICFLVSQLSRTYTDILRKSASRFGDGDMVELTQQETTILARKAQGFLQKDIAGEMGVSNKTIQRRTIEAQEKLGAYSIEHTVSMAISLGIISTSEWPRLSGAYRAEQGLAQSPMAVGPDPEASCAGKDHEGLASKQAAA